MCKQRGLSVQRCSEIVSGPLEAQGAELEPKRVIDLLEDLSRPGKGFGEIFSHSRLLRALSREKQYDVHLMELC